jgi:hypothetical protein
VTARRKVKVTGLGAYSKGRKVFYLYPNNPWLLWLQAFVTEHGLCWPREYDVRG